MSADTETSQVPTSVKKWAAISLGVATLGVSLWLVWGRMDSDGVYMFIFALGVVAFLRLGYQIWSIMRENYLDYFAFSSATVGETKSEAKPFAREDSLILEWARECLKVGRSLEAGMKLERISSELRKHPEVLKLRYEIFKTEKRWHAALDAAVDYSQVCPDDIAGWLGQAVCLHEMKLSQQALNMLLKVTDRFPEKPMIPFYIALFTTELGRLEQARKWLFKSLEIGDKPKLISLAMNEPDMEPLMHFLGRKAMVEKLVSGGLSGAERTAMDFASAHGIPHGGWCPRARAGEDGYIQKRYNLKETPSSGYLQRTEWNVRGSEGTVIFSVGDELTGASARVNEFTQAYGKPCLHLKRDQAPSAQAQRLLKFLHEHHIQVLNVAGSSASKEPHIGEFVNEALERAFMAKLKWILQNAGEESLEDE
jgi:tetratricopeptide (TPR) repeat protein